MRGFGTSAKSWRMQVVCVLQPDHCDPGGKEGCHNGIVVVFGNIL